MFSKWSLWDFFKINPTIVQARIRGIYSLSIFDSLLEVIIKNKLPKDVIQGYKLRTVFGEDITVDFLNEKFQTYDLFQEPISLWVLRADNISKAVQEYILENIDIFNETRKFRLE